MKNERLALKSAGAHRVTNDCYEWRVGSSGEENYTQ